MGWQHDFSAELEALENRDLRRVRRVVAGVQGPHIDIDGRRVICLASNNYLGLADDTRVIAGGVAALHDSGAGAGASALISGHMDLHEQFEAELAGWLGAEAALVFGSGYHANIGVIAALVGAGDVIFSDALNHASLIDGCRLSRAERVVYRHCDLADLEAKLQAHPGRRRLIVSDSVFSMDGDLAPLAGIVALAEEYGAEILLDEAHAVGVFGPQGAGYAEALGLGDRIGMRMGTMGKALGSYGAFVVGSRPLIDLLVNRARSYVFSTSLPPSIVGAARAAVAIVRNEPERRAQLWSRARQLHAALEGGGYQMQPLASPILPLILGTSADAVAVATSALAGGVFAPAIRPPTVPTGTARMRVTPIATHTQADMEQAAAILVAARSAG